MIPKDLDEMVKNCKRWHEIPKKDHHEIHEYLRKHKIPLESDFAQFVMTYSLDLVTPSSDFEDLMEVRCEIEGLSTTEYVIEEWGVPEKYVALSSIEGEGCYLYDKETGQVVDFNLADTDEFLAGEIPVLANSFFDFMRLYLAPSPDQDET